MGIGDAEGATAVAADQQSFERRLGGIAPCAGFAIAVFPQQILNFIPECPVDNTFLLAIIHGVLVPNHADVNRINQNAVNVNSYYYTTTYPGVYAAADHRIGIAEGCLADIVAYVRSFDAQGKSLLAVKKTELILQLSHLPNCQQRRYPLSERKIVLVLVRCPIVRLIFAELSRLK